MDGLVAGLVVRDAGTGSLLRLANDGDMSLDNICENATKQFLLYVQRFLMGNDVCEWEEACLRRQAAQALLYKLAGKRLICGCPCRFAFPRLCAFRIPRLFGEFGNLKRRRCGLRLR